MPKLHHLPADTSSWNPCIGCSFDCIYCRPAFKAQARRAIRRCQRCADFEPHCHPERLDTPPSVPNILVCGSGDISFCSPDFTREILARIRSHNQRRPHKLYFLQSKRPEYFAEFLGELPSNVVLTTTYETNHDEGYEQISKAPPPSERHRQFLALDYPRKVVSLEPLLDFDSFELCSWLTEVRPEFVWIGFNSRPHAVSLPEPPDYKVLEFAYWLNGARHRALGKDLRGLQLRHVESAARTVARDDAVALW